MLHAPPPNRRDHRIARKNKDRDPPGPMRTFPPCTVIGCGSSTGTAVTELDVLCRVGPGQWSGAGLLIPGPAKKSRVSGRHSLSVPPGGTASQRCSRSRTPRMAMAIVWSSTRASRSCSDGSFPPGGPVADPGRGFTPPVGHAVCDRLGPAVPGGEPLASSDTGCCPGDDPSPLLALRVASRRHVAGRRVIFGGHGIHDRARAPSTGTLTPGDKSPDPRRTLKPPIWASR